MPCNTKAEYKYKYNINIYIYSKGRIHDEVYY